jgi:hypothetical protein
LNSKETPINHKDNFFDLDAAYSDNSIIHQQNPKIPIQFSARIGLSRKYFNSLRKGAKVDILVLFAYVGRVNMHVHALAH